ncbi:hypothetical protein [Mameliella alba]|uniref:hypothetical protein n=1 Tax=Mameliella alba TaxID=561184 RepID=UPI000942345B|nr:hypothetical protein [Mameliella alba]OWV49687.1 hypothetical protein CDZ96_04740 [Mameliella alba]GGF53517.1 hypothetical protein GCM10011319_13700 [Mameliella alba]
MKTRILTILAAVTLGTQSVEAGRYGPDDSEKILMEGEVIAYAAQNGFGLVVRYRNEIFLCRVGTKTVENKRVMET